MKKIFKKVLSGILAVSAAAAGACMFTSCGKSEVDAAHTRKASKKAVRKAQAEATAGTKSSRLQFTDEDVYKRQV